jgi:hypothetical protein
MRRREVEVMFTETQWDHEVDVVCIGAEGGVLAAGLVAGGVGRAQSFWPVRAVEEVAPPRSHRRQAVEPFFGAALEQWAHRCPAAPNGLVYNRVTRRQMTEMRSCARGEKVEVAVVGSVELSPTLPVFEDDGVAGALIETQDGVLAVCARENLIIGTRDFPMERTHPLVTATESVTASVCLVSKPASRFGEIEIVTTTGDDDRLLFVDAPEAELQLASGL